MELPFVLSIYHFCQGLKPILEYCHFWAIFPEEEAMRDNVALLCARTPTFPAPEVDGDKDF